MTIGLGHYLSVGAILFTLGILGIFLNRKNIIVILMSIELILLAVNINLVAFSTFLGDIVGQVFALLVLYLTEQRGLRGPAGCTCSPQFSTRRAGRSRTAGPDRARL